jgi:2',3'-cyclic-nucleotide 2'-phosphodiesterase (5'-nucleotidase family)
MSDEPITEGRATPRLSEEAIAEYRRLLSDPKLAEERPEWHAMLKQTVDAALALTQQSLDGPQDARTVGQVEYDRRYAMQASPVLVDAVIRDSRGAEQQDPEAVRAAFTNTGRSYADALRDAQHAVSSTPSLAGVQVEKLPAATLASLAVFGAHHRKFSAQRPR